MKFLLDQGVARSVSGMLREAGHDSVHVGECNLTTADDGAILEYARAQDRVVVTFDSDFSALLAISSAAKPSVIHIRIEGINAQSQSALLQQLANAYVEELHLGAILSVQPHAVRRKNLPIR